MHSWSARIRYLAGFVLLGVVLTGCPSNNPDDYSYSFATWNVQYLDTFAAVLSDQCCDQIADRDAKVEASIRQSGYDVIVLQEAFTDTVQKDIAERLRDTYPYQVTHIDGDNDKSQIDGNGFFRKVSS